MGTIFRPTLLYRDGRFVSDGRLHVDNAGRISNETTETPSVTGIDFAGKALLPGFVNAHSHSFQRLIRGRAESRAVSGKDFWSWRNTMYQAAAELSPDDVYDVARMCFLEMVRAGITTVGEFHYLHTTPDAKHYDDPNELAKRIVAAARSVGLRIVLLRSAYLRSGYEVPPDPGQRRFFETTEAFLANSAALMASYPADSDEVRFGVAPHSIRAVPLDDVHAIAAWARTKHLPIHMHVAEQVAENFACEREYGHPPVELLAKENLLSKNVTVVHAIHINPHEIAILADAGVIVCSCTTTERNLGDGIVPADALMRLGVRHALGSDSQAEIDPLEDARQLDYHLRLAQQQRAILDQIDDLPIARRLLECATSNGARALAIDTGALKPGEHADMISIDLRDLSIAGNTPDDLLPLVVFGMHRSAIRDVIVNGKVILRDGRHPLQDEIVARYEEVYRKVWGARGEWRRQTLSAVVEHLSQLIRIPSVSAMSNRPVIDDAASALLR